MNTFKKITLTSAVAFALLAFNACGDDSGSSSGPGDNGGGRAGVPDTVQTMEELLSDVPCGESQKCIATYLVEFNDKAVCDGEDGWVFGTLIEKMDCDFSSSSDKSSDSKSNDPAGVTDDSSDSKDNPSSAGTSTKSSSSAKETKNSSDSRSSSSSKAKVSSSSSVALATPCKTETEDNCEYGTLLDERDGQEYKTVKIGDQWWMAENLNYSNGDSYCYADSAEYCEKYGRLYYYGSVRGNKLCPSGWRSPDTSDFQILVSAVGGVKVAGQMLKSTTGWVKRGEDVNGVDAFGFSALPAGKMWLEGTERGWTNWTKRSFFYLNEETIFWMNGMSSSNQPIEYYLRTIFYYPSLRLYFSDVAELFRTVDYYAVSVRCIKEIE